MVNLIITVKIQFHYEMNLSELTFVPLKSFLMISVEIKISYFAQVGFIMEANFGNNNLHG